MKNFIKLSLILVLGMMMIACTPTKRRVTVPEKVEIVNEYLTDKNLFTIAYYAENGDVLGIYYVIANNKYEAHHIADDLSELHSANTDIYEADNFYYQSPWKK